MIAALTCRQESILCFAVQYLLVNGYPPTIREIGHEFGIRSTNGVRDHLVALHRKGFLAALSNAARGLKFTRTALALVPQPPNALPKKKDKRAKGEKTALATSGASAGGTAVRAGGPTPVLPRITA